MFDITNRATLSDCIKNWLPLVEEILDINNSKVLFVGTKIDKKEIYINSKTYKPFTNKELEVFDKKLNDLVKENNKYKEAQWIDWTYVNCIDSKGVTDTVKRILKHFTV